MMSLSIHVQLLSYQLMVRKILQAEGFVSFHVNTCLYLAHRPNYFTPATLFNRPFQAPYLACRPLHCAVFAAAGALQVCRAVVC